MQIILLVEEKMKPIPDTIKVVQEFGAESIILTNNDTLSVNDLYEKKKLFGTSMFLEGSPEDFKKWLKPFDGVAITTNTMMGKWEIVHIKEDSEENVQA